MIRSFQALNGFVSHEPLDADKVVSGDVTTGSSEAWSQGNLLVGVWEHSVGTSVDEEALEVFVVLEGSGTVVCSEGGLIELAPGVVGLLPAGAKTTWTVTKPLRKVWITIDS